MSTTVTKGTNRPAAVAKTSKAAQRTVLPAKVTPTDVPTDLTKMTIAKLRALALDRGRT